MNAPSLAPRRREPPPAAVDVEIPTLRAHDRLTRGVVVYSRCRPATLQREPSRSEPMTSSAFACGARLEIEAALDRAGWPWSRGLSLWLDALLVLEAR